MKRFFLLLIVFLLVAFAMSPALGEEKYPLPEYVETDSLTWEFDADTGTLSIHGTGPMRSYYPDPPEWEAYKDQITIVQMDEGITSVGDSAFYNYPNLQIVLLPDSIEIVDQYAFYYCWMLQSITIPENLRFVGYMSFYNTLIHDPVDIIFPEGMEYIGENAFHSAMKTGGKYVIPSTVRYIGPCAMSNALFSDIIVDEGNAFYKSENHTLLTKDGTELLMYAPDAEETSYSVPDGVVKIDAESFNIVQHLEKLSIPASVTEIEDAAFFSTFNLNEITVAEDNPAYKIIDGALCTIDGKEYLAFPDGIELSEIIIPDGVERIAPYVFYGRPYDTKYPVTLPESVKIIGKMSMPPSVSTINIPKAVTTIEPYAFCYENGVDEVVYGGTETDWQAIEIGDGNKGLDSAVIRYNE